MRGHIAVHSGGGTYRITVLNLRAKCRGVAAVTVDGPPVESTQVPVSGDRGAHREHHMAQIQKELGG